MGSVGERSEASGVPYGRNRASIDAPGNRTTLVLDAAGRQVALVNALSKRFTTVFDAADRPRATIDPLSNRISFTHDAAGQRAATVDGLNHRWSQLYDKAGRVRAEINPLLHRVTYTIDLAGQRKAVRDAKNNVVTTVFDAVGRGAATINALGIRTSQLFDAAGQQRALIDGRGNRYTFLRDEVGQVRAQADPLSRRVSFGWDLAGQQRFKLDARLVRISYTHDNEGRQIGRQYPDGMRVTQTWDAVSNRTLLHDASGRYTSTFDSLNRVRTATTPANKKLTYSWDAVSQRRVMIEPEGGRFSYGWDDAGRIRFLVNPQDQRTSWTHDAANRVTVQRLGNGSRVSNAYDDGNRLIRLANLTSAGATLSSFRDAWDNAGNRTSRVEESGVRVTWSYDNSYQLTRERRSGANSYDLTCTYDQASNRRSTLADGVLTTYTCDAANQLLTTKNVSGTTTFTWDQAGNLATQRTPANAVTTNLWDHDNRLRAVILPSAARYTSTYQGDGQRVQKQESGSTAKLFWDATNILLETDNADVTQVVYTVEPLVYGNLISQRRSGATRYYFFDPVGGTDRLTDSNEAETDSYLYKAFGEVVTSSGSTLNPFQWVGIAGYYRESVPDIYNVRARWLRSALGRWLSLDDPRMADSPNDYLYAKANPLRYRDPGGRACYPCYCFCTEETLGVGDVIPPPASPTVTMTSITAASLKIAQSLCSKQCSGTTYGFGFTYTCSGAIGPTALLRSPSDICDHLSCGCPGCTRAVCLATIKRLTELAKEVSIPAIDWDYIKKYGYVDHCDRWEIAFGGKLFFYSSPCIKTFEPRSWGKLIGGHAATAVFFCNEGVVYVDNGYLGGDDHLFVSFDIPGLWRQR